MRSVIIKIVFFYLCGMNLLTFVVYGTDKWKAIRHRYRISERCLLGMAAGGGGIGAFAGMQIFRHKTKHCRFRILVPIFAVLYGMLAVWCGFDWIMK